MLNATAGTNPTGNVLTNDTDADSGDTKTVSAITGGTVGGSTAGIYGTLVLNSDGSYNYTVNNANATVQALNIGGTLTDTFTYTMRDAAGLTSSTTLAVTITGANDAPVAVTNNYTMAEDGAAITLTPLTGDSDVDGTTPTIQSINGTNLTPGVAQVIAVTGGTVNVSATGAITFTPTLNFNGTVTFPYVITDGTLTSTANQVITVTAVNDAPVNTLPSYTVNEDTALKLSGLSITDVDASTGSMTVTLSVPSGNGIIAATSAGSVTVLGSGTSSITLTGTLVDINAYLASTTNQPSYTPAQNASGTVQLTMLTSDQGNTGTGGTLTDTDTVNITITPISDPISDSSSVSVVVGAAINNTIDLASSTADGVNTYTFPNGVVMSSGSGANFNQSSGNTLGISGGGSSNRIEGSESVVFSFPSGMQYFAMNVKNAADDTIKLTAGLEVPDLASTGTITGQITSSLVTPSASTMQVSLVLLFTDATTTTATATVSSGGAWTLNYNTGGKTIASANIVALVDGDLFSQGGGSAGLTTFNISTDMKSYTIQQDTNNTYSSGSGNNGFQISAVVSNASITGTGFSYPIDLYALNPDPSETITSLKLSDLPADIQSLTVVLANGTYVEINPVGGVYDLSAYTGLLSSTTGTSGTDKIYLNTSTALSAGYSPTMSVESLDESTTSITTIGGSASSSHAGGAGNDYINGGAGSDTINGGAGDDILVGGSGNDTIRGGSGNDTMTGGAVGVNDLTSDTFIWNLADAGTLATPAIDTINNFGTGTAATGGDVLDLRDLLTGTATDAASLDNYLHFEKSGSDTILYVSSDGSFGDGNNVGAPNATVLANDVQQIVFTGVDLIGGLPSDLQVIQNLITQQKLITD